MADKLMLGASVTTNLSQRIFRLPAYRLLSVTFIPSQLGPATSRIHELTETHIYGRLTA